MTARRLVTLCVFLLSALCSAQAQDYLYATGSPVYSTQIPIDHGFINVNNGEIHLEIPLSNKQQRGDFALDEKLIYDSRIWKIVQNGSYSWQPQNIPSASGGWTFSSGTGSGSLTWAVVAGLQKGNPCSDAVGANTSYTQFMNWVWTDPNGTKHTFPNPVTSEYNHGQPDCNGNINGTPTGTGTASDGSGYTINVTNYKNATIQDLSGKVYYPSSTGSATDRNGSAWSSDSSGNLIDTSGQTPVVMTVSGNSTYYDVLGAGGKRNRYTVVFTTVSFNTNFAESTVTEATGSFSAVQSITLPDGSSYNFTYDSGTTAGHYGELTGMTLPTGGSISYGYLNFLDSYNNENRWLNSIVKDGGVTTFTPSTLSKCSSSAGCKEAMTVHNPAGNETVYTFTADKAAQVAGQSWISSINTYQGTATTGTLLQSTSTSYSYTTYSQYYNSGQTPVTATYTTPASVTNYVTLSDINYTSETLTTFLATTPLPAETKSWDFYNASGYAPTTDAVFAYNSLGEPTSAVVKDGTGHQLSNVAYGYDETALAATTNLPNHTAPPGPQRGNRTSEHDWINTSGSTLDTFMTYDDAGTMLTSTSPNGKTTYGHDATDTYTTSVTAPTPSSGVALTTTTAYDASTGAVTSNTDANNQAVNYKNFDIFNRPQEIDNPDGGITQLSYTPTQSSVSAQNSATGWTIKSYDSYGRLIRTNEATGVSSSPWYMQDTCYNATGQVSFQSYRFQGQFSQAPVCSGAGDSYAYNALGRTTQLTHGDGTRVLYKYVGRATQVTDENNVSKITQTDAFGRVTAVCELTTSSMAGSGTPGACGTDIAGTGFLTSYTYDLANHKTTVTQGVQTRIFQTDSLGRTILTQEPESGQTTYSYDSTGLLVTRVKPRANQADPTVLTTTYTQYDALGRIVNTTYSDGTPSRYFDYDTQGGWGRAQANVKGRLQRASSPVPVANKLAATIFSYDAMGRVAFTGQCQPSGCYNGARDTYTSYAYDYAGNLTSASSGAGTTIGYSYTPAAEITSITSSVSDAMHPGTLVSNVVNGPYGPYNFQYGNGLTGVRGYSGLGQRTGGWVCSGSSSASCSGGTQLYGFTITPQGGRVNQACDSALSNCASMGYDDLNRLTARTTTSGTTSNNTWSYDRYGNRWTQTATLGGNGNVSYNTANNRETGFSYDAAGNMASDGIHNYTYDAEGNITQVDGGATASYTYDALNRRVRTVVGGNAYEFVFDPNGRRVAMLNGSTGAVLEQNAYWGALPLDYDLNGALHFEHGDWVGTERLTTGYNGAREGGYASAPFGDGLSASGSDPDPYHFAMLDHDNESGLDHALYRGYSSAQGHWMSPDPYSGSYDWSSPQSLNRYSYVGNNPLSLNDPTGQEACLSLLAAGAEGGAVGETAAAGACLAELFFGANFINDVVGLFVHPSFHGSLKPRPNAQPWDEHNIMFGPNIAGALGLPDSTCEFGVCGGGGFGFQSTGVALGGSVLCQLAEPCGVIEDFGLLVGTLGVASYDIYQMSKGGKGQVGHDYVRDLARTAGGDYCSALKDIVDSARRTGNSKLFNDAKATYKQDCRGY